MKNITTKTLYVLCLIGLLAGIGLGEAISSIWSNVVEITVVNPPSTLTLATDKATYDTSQIVALTATLHDPTPATEQSVVFYFSKVPGANINTPIITPPAQLDPTTGFIPLIDGDIAKSSVMTVNGVAHITCSVGLTGHYYFRAAVLSPTT